MIALAECGWSVSLLTNGHTRDALIVHRAAQHAAGEPKDFMLKRSSPTISMPQVPWLHNCSTGHGTDAEVRIYALVWQQLIAGEAERLAMAPVS